MKRILTLAVSLVLLGAGCGAVPSMDTDSTSPTVLEPTETTTPVEPVAMTDAYKIFMIALDGNGASGKLIGCGDSVVPVGVTVPNTSTPLTEVLKALLATKGQFYGQSGLYNSLYQSQLQLASATIVGGKATVKLTGTHALGGTCDAPRFESQIVETIKQFPTVTSADVYINDKKLADVLSSK